MGRQEERGRTMLAQIRLRLVRELAGGLDVTGARKEGRGDGELGDEVSAGSDPCCTAAKTSRSGLVVAGGETGLCVKRLYRGPARVLI